MKYIGLITLLALCSCGGGGGGGSSPEDVCSEYCDRQCNRVADCLDVSSNAMGNCASDCFIYILSNGGADSDSCIRADNELNDMNCTELISAIRIFAGVARTADYTDLGNELAHLIRSDR